MIKLSKPGKMPCQSWSLPAGDTCPGAKRNGQWVDACAGCYAREGNYRFKNVRAVREHNRDDWQRDDWADDMVDAIQWERFFRWFDSGDCYSVGLARKILEVMQRTPEVNHWFPTRQHKFAKFQPILEEMQQLPNVVVRYSSDSVHGETVPGATTSTIIPATDHPAAAGKHVCPAYANDGKCGSCRACWHKSVAVVAYPAHGRSMLRIIASTGVDIDA